MLSCMSHLCLEVDLPCAPKFRAQMAVVLRHPQLAMRCHISMPDPLSKLALAGASTEQDRQRLWYLAFGADMNHECLTKQRGIQPTASLPCVLEGYTLSFAYRGALAIQGSPVRQHRQCRVSAPSGYMISCADSAGLEGCTALSYMMAVILEAGGLCSPLKHNGCQSGGLPACKSRSDLQAMLPAGLPYVEPSLANIEPLQWQPPPPMLSLTHARSVPTVEPHQPSSQAVATTATMYRGEQVVAQTAVSPACLTWCHL